MADLLTLIGSIVPILLLIGSTIVAFILVDVSLSATECRFRIEASAVASLVTFVLLQSVLGVRGSWLTLLILLPATLLVLYEAFRPTKTAHSIDYQELGPDYSDVLCLSTGRIYTVLAAARITGIPRKEKSRKDDDDDELKLLHPLWEDSKQSGTVYTVEAGLRNGLTEIFVFISNSSKNWKLATKQARRSREIVETWLNQMDYAYDVLSKDQFHYLPAYQEASLLVEGLPKRLSSNLGVLLQRLAERRVDSRVQFSFTAGVLPRMSKDAGAIPESQTKTPYRVEEHHLRDVYKQMAEVEACEETGVFRACVQIFGERGETMNQLESIVRSVWSGVRIAAAKVRTRDQLRDQVQGCSFSSGAKLMALLDFSVPIPGVTRRMIPPEFLLPLPESVETSSILLGKVMFRGKKLDQTYGIPKDHFCHHVGIYGGTGSGKTNTAKRLLKELDMHGVSFLVIDPSTTEFRELCECVDDLRVFTLGDEETAPFRYNPFHVLPGVPIQKHIENLATCFIAHWPTEGILVEHIMKVFRRVYDLAGWDPLTSTRGRPITLSDLAEAKDSVIGEFEYGARLNQDLVGAFKARFESVLDDSVLAVILNAERGITISELLEHPTILELRSLSESKAGLVTSLLLAGISEYLQSRGRLQEQELRHLLILEEAHHLLKQVNTGGGLFDSHAIQQQAINGIVGLLREARGYGLGTIILDQNPGDLAPSAVKLPGITITHFLKDSRERILVGSQANLSDEQIGYIGELEKGEAIIHSGFNKQAINVQIGYFRMHPTKDVHHWTNERIVCWMKGYYVSNPHMMKQQLPIIDSWKPNPNILRNLEFLTKDDRFVESLDVFLDTSSGRARTLVENLLAKHHASTESSEVDQYTSLFLNYLKETERCGFGA